MAESPENKKTAKDKLNDDLDAMLDESQSAMDRGKELIDDEDAIDRLLMDNAFDSQDDEEDEFAEIDELISESLNDSDTEAPSEPDEEFDEFADDEDDLIVAAEAKMNRESNQSEDEFGDEDEIEAEIEPVSTEGMVEIDEFDEFSDIADDELELAGTPERIEAPEETEQESSTIVEDQLDDQLMSDFDISADDDSISDENLDDSVDSSGESYGEQVINEPVTEIAESKLSQEHMVALAEISSQLATLQSAHDALKQKLKQLEEKDTTAPLVDELDELASSQKKAQRRLGVLEQQKPVFAYAALAIAIIALIVGVGLGMVGFSADSRVSELSDTVVSLEEQVDAWIANSKNSDELNTALARLDKMDIEVANFSTRLYAVNETLKASGSDTDTKQLREQLAQLNERNIQTAAVLEALQLKVDELDDKKLAAINKAKKRATVVRENWFVNLVSFKQEWYAKRKAAEFEKQGVPAEVSSVVIKGETWYRLRVKGFKNKYEAAAYAAKVKKMLNLTSTWVTKD